MLTERPFTSKWSIVGSYRPGTDEQREGVFKGLRSKGLVSDGIQRGLQERHSGKLAGQMRLYCVLNQDAARLARHGFDADAAKFVKRASTIEHSKDAALLADAVAKHVTVITANYDNLISSALASLVSDSTLREALVRVTEQVAKTRAASRALAQIQRVAIGQVVTLHGDLAEVLLSGGMTIAIDRDLLAEHNLYKLGSPVALHWENWGKGQAFLEAEPALDLNAASDPLQARFAFLRHPPASGDVWNAAATITGAVSIGRHVTVSRATS